jgi:hypothetical protein
MSKYVDLMNTSRKQARTGGARWASTRATNEPLAMLEMLVAKYVESEVDKAGRMSTNGKKKSSTHPTIHPLGMISIFKDYLKSEETIFRFDLLTLNQRCVELLRKVQAVCVEQSPLDYPVEEFASDHQFSNCFSHMMAGVLGPDHQQLIISQEACLIVKEVVKAEGDVEYGKAKSRCCIKGDGKKKVMDEFATPVEDTILLSDRAKFGRVIIIDGSPGSGITII